MSESTHKAKVLLTTLLFGILAIIVLGLVWFWSGARGAPVGFGWYLFSFSTGLTMIVLPCTLPLAFVIVPLSMGKSAAKGLGIAVAFSLGVAIMLSIYGIIAAYVGEEVIGRLGTPLETVKNWLYLIAGVFAYVFALGEIGILKWRMPSYTGAAPAFIGRQQEFIKVFFLGLFLGNVGVGCPHPATPVILTRIAASGDMLYGWLLFFVHALGRILPLLFLAILAILGVNALRWLMERKDHLERATGWAMVYVAGFILVLGLFTHDWWVYSGQHTLFESLTKEESILNAIAGRIGAPAVHAHGIPQGSGLFGLPLPLGNWFLVFLWVLPLWWYYLKIKRAAATFSEDEHRIEHRVRPLRFWFSITLTLLLALTVIWVLPDRFLNHTAHGEVHEEKVASPAGSMMAGRAMKDHGEAHVSLNHEEGEVKEGIVVKSEFRDTGFRNDGGYTVYRLTFFVRELPRDRGVAASELELNHERLMHVIGVRDDLNEFFHIHPQPDERITPGAFSLSHTFRKPGIYKVWSEVMRRGVTHTIGHPTFRVSGAGPNFEKDVSFARNVIAGNYQVALETSEPLVKGRSSTLSFDVHTLTEQEVEVEPFLGSAMHLSIIKDDLRQFIHTHPDEGGGEHARFKLIPYVYAHGETAQSGLPHEEDINFTVTFPEAGLYKIFGQWRPKGSLLPPGEAITASFWVEVSERGGISPRLILFIFSIAAILLLSLGVKKFITVKKV